MVSPPADHYQRIVCDSAGHPLENVNVKLLNTPSGTYTDNQGTFFLSVPTDEKEYILFFSHIGYKTEERIV